MENKHPRVIDLNHLIDGSETIDPNDVEFKRTILISMLGVLQLVREDIEAGNPKTTGLCSYFLLNSERYPIRCKAKFLEYASDWEYFSGSSRYPVPESYAQLKNEDAAREAYAHGTNVRWFENVFYQGEYGELREKLINYVFKRLIRDLVELNQVPEE